MADYYNRTKAPVPVVLVRGGSITIGPKKWTYIETEDEGSESLQTALKKGYLVAAKVPLSHGVVTPAAVPVAVESPRPANPAPVGKLPEPEPAPVPVEIPASEVQEVPREEPPALQAEPKVTEVSSAPVARKRNHR